MSDVKQTVTERNVSGVDQTGENVQQTSRQVHTERPVSNRWVASNIIWYLYGLIATLLAIRFILKLTGANSENGFASFIYSITNFLTAPFDSLFGTSSTAVGQTQSVFQPSVLVAIAVYALIAWGVVKLINIATRDSLTQ
ncbi:MAG: YggT family protein [Patescibacteria group bacterium]|nr:YggT family protein [Patescibacteria group bacterium]